MKILIRKEPWMGMGYGTGAECKAHFDRNKNYSSEILPYAGEWMQVDTEYLFQNSFNGIGASGGLVHIRALMVDAVDLEDTFNSVEEWQEAVTKHYAKSWPGMPSKLPNYKMYKNGKGLEIR